LVFAAAMAMIIAVSAHPARAQQPGGQPGPMTSVFQVSASPAPSHPTGRRPDSASIRSIVARTAPGSAAALTTARHTPRPGWQSVPRRALRRHRATRPIITRRPIAVITPIRPAEPAAYSRLVDPGALRRREKGSVGLPETRFEPNAAFDFRAGSGGRRPVSIAAGIHSITGKNWQRRPTAPTLSPN